MWSFSWVAQNGDHGGNFKDGVFGFSGKRGRGEARALPQYSFDPIFRILSQVKYMCRESPDMSLQFRNKKIKNTFNKLLFLTIVISQHYLTLLQICLRGCKYRIIFHINFLLGDSKTTTNACNRKCRIICNAFLADFKCPLKDAKSQPSWWWPTSPQNDICSRFSWF